MTLFLNLFLLFLLLFVLESFQTYKSRMKFMMDTQLRSDGWMAPHCVVSATSATLSIRYTFWGLGKIIALYLRLSNILSQHHFQKPFSVENAEDISKKTEHRGLHEPMTNFNMGPVLSQTHTPTFTCPHAVWKQRPDKPTFIQSMSLLTVIFVYMF